MPTPTPRVGPFVMSVEFPTPKADEPTHRIPYEEVRTIEEAVAWIRHPPFPPETLKKLKKGVLLTARMRAEWVQENGQRGEEIAAMGLVLRVGTRNVPTKIAVVTRDGISVDGEPVSAGVLGLTKASTSDIVLWMSSGSSATDLLGAHHGVPWQLLALTTCAVVRTVLPLVQAGEDRPRVALETAEAWAYGRATFDQVKKAKDDVRSIGEVPRSVVWAVTGALAVNAVGAASYASYAVAHFEVVARQAQIVRGWIGLPEVVFAAVTRRR